MLVTHKRGTYVDATLGGGGHSAALTQQLSPQARVVGIDRDAEAVSKAGERLQAATNFEAVQGYFGDLPSLLQHLNIRAIDGLLLDLGVSSYQLDCACRGFSHRHDGPLDMRMDQSQGVPASRMVNKMSASDLTRMLARWGEVPQAWRIAKRIVRERPVHTTAGLAEIVRRATYSRHESKTLARVFQAIRIAVNGELEQLASVLQHASEVMATGGRLVVISYHSLEDRLVKRTMRYGNLAGEPVHDLYGTLQSPWRPLLKAPVRPSSQEVECNPRARSAKLRAAERTSISDRKMTGPI